MTAQIDTYSQEGGAATHLIGQDWQKLIDLIESRPDEDKVKCFDGGGYQLQHHLEDNVLRTLQDVKRLRQKDMPLFGRCPETDNFYTVVCSLCSMILMPNALKDHWEKRHADNSKSTSSDDKQSAISSGKIKSKKVTPSKSEKVEKIEKIEKIEKVEKAKKAKNNFLSEINEEVFKDSKRTEKSKKGKPLEKHSEIENSLVSRSDKSKPKGTKFSQDLQPIVALSPIQVAENGDEGNEGKDTPKNKKRDKKKNERKGDKIFDPDKHCGVINESGKPCVRSILCKVHQVALKRAVVNRTMPYDMLIRILKSHNDEEKIKAENGTFNRLPKIEPGDRGAPEEKEPQSLESDLQTSKVYASDPVSIKVEEPPIKRLKIKTEIMEVDVDQNQFTLPSHLEALIDETLKTLKDVDETETLPMIPETPKPEPLIKWNFELETAPKAPSPPPHIVLDDIHWHSSHPKPLATNTFGCRLIGGLMSTCKKLDTLRKHLQSVWTSSSSAPASIRSGFNEMYNANNGQKANVVCANPKNNSVLSKYIKKSSQNKGASLVKKTVPSILTKGTAVKRKKRSNSNLMAGAQNPTSTASDIISGLLISNPVSVQRTGSASVPTIPTGVIPVNSITGNGMPLRLFQGSLPVIASAAPSQPTTFIQLNLCPPK